MCKSRILFSVVFVNRKDLEVKNLNSKLEDEQSLVAQLQRKIKELLVSYQSLFYHTGYSAIENAKPSCKHVRVMNTPLHPTFI